MQILIPEEAEGRDPVNIRRRKSYELVVGRKEKRKTKKKNKFWFFVSGLLRLVAFFFSFFSFFKFCLSMSICFNPVI